MSDKYKGNYAVVFSGGGALGSWEIGAYKELFNTYGYSPIAVSGASSGALNAAAIASQIEISDIEDIWKKLKPENVYKHKFPKKKLGQFFMAIRAIFSKAYRDKKLNETSYFDSAPLEKTLRRELGGEYYNNFLSSKIDLAFSVSDLSSVSRKYYYKSKHGFKRPNHDWLEIDAFDELIKGLMASTAIPILFPPKDNLYDGGVLLNQPLLQAFNLGTSEKLNKDDRIKALYVLIPTVERYSISDGLLPLAKRLLDVWLGAGFSFQRKALKKINKIANYNFSDPSKNSNPVALCIIRPPTEDIDIGLLDFGKDVDKIINKGVKNTRDRLKLFDPENSETWDFPSD